MGKFCTNCGSALDENGKCPKCDAEVKAEEKKPSETVSPATNAPKETDEKKENDTKKEIIEKSENDVKKEIVEKEESPKKKKPANEGLKKKAKITLVVTIVVLSVYTVSLVTLGTLVYFDKIKMPFINDIFIHMNWKEEKVEEIPAVENVEGENPENPEQQPDTPDVQEPLKPFEVTREDADEYFQNNSTVASQILATDSTEVLSESEVYDKFSERGFNQEAIITNYSMQGEYSEDRQISSYSSTKHPVYHTLYVTSSGNVWQILDINGTIMANPLSYNQDAENQVIVSETDVVASYDSTLNKFYVTKPNASILSVKTVERIDAETLDNMTGGEFR